MAVGDLGILVEKPIKVAQNSDVNYTIFAYDVVLGEDDKEVSRSRMDLSSATIVFQVKDTVGKITGSPTAAFAVSGSDVTLTDSTASFDSTAIGKEITIAGATSGDNDGTFTITDVPSATTVVYTNALGVAEAQGSATYSISDIVINKQSSITSQIEIHADQVTESTKGTAILKLVGVDTSGLVVGSTYYYDIWVHKGGGKKPIVTKSKFHVTDGVYEPAVGPPSASPADPAVQAEQERSFQYTTVADGDSFTVSIPGSGMVDSSYVGFVDITTIPGGGSYSPNYIDNASKTPTQFDIKTSAIVLTGTVFDIFLRDLT
jgi:hypothetical protein